MLLEVDDALVANLHLDDHAARIVLVGEDLLDLRSGCLLRAPGLDVDLLDRRIVRLGQLDHLLRAVHVVVVRPGNECRPVAIFGHYALAIRSKTALPSVSASSWLISKITPVFEQRTLTMSEPVFTYRKNLYS